MQTPPKLRLAETSTPRPDLAAQLAAPLAAATSSAHAAMGRPGPATMTATATARLSVWREVSSRWLVFALLPGLLPLGRLFNNAVDASSWLYFLFMTVAPLVCILAAAGGRAESDAFWRGLGGPAWARQLGRQAVHLVLVGGAIVALHLELQVQLEILSQYGKNPSEFEPLTLFIYPALYASVAAARTRLSGLSLIVGPLAGLVVIGAGLFSSSIWMHDWSLSMGFAVRTVGFTAAALALSYRWERTAGVWGSAVSRSRRRFLTPALVLVGLTAASVGIELVWSRGILPPNYVSTSITSDGSMTLYRSKHNSLSNSLNVRYWTHSAEDGFRRLPGWHNEAYLGERGSVLGFTSHVDDQRSAGFFATTHPQTSEVTPTLMSSGQSLSCDQVLNSNSVSDSQWRSDGRGVLLSLGNIGQQYILDLDSGACGLTSNQLYLGDELVELESSGVRWRNQTVDFADSLPAQQQWDASRNAVLVHGPQQHLYSIDLHDQQLRVTGPISSLEESIIVQTAKHTAVWAWQDGAGHQPLSVVSNQRSRLRDMEGTVRITTTEHDAAMTRPCPVPDDWRSGWIHAAEELVVSRAFPGSEQPSLSRKQLISEDVTASLRVSTRTSHCSVVHSTIFSRRHRIEVGETTVRWNGQEVPFGEGPQTSGQWDGLGHASLIRGPQDQLYTVGIHDQVLSVAGPFSDFEASGEVDLIHDRWLSERVIWMADSSSVSVLDILDGTTWDLSELGLDPNQVTNSANIALVNNEIVQLGDHTIPAIAAQR